MKAYSYIRFSTPEQLKGDSLRRQLELSEKYCKNNDLELIEDFRDEGVSAFKSKNIESKLGLFIEAVESERIEKGSFLLIESLDRLSRDKVLTAFKLFTSILEKGITIVTLLDNQIYTEESINTNIGNLFTSLGIMVRANNESEVKSDRLKKTWKNKRENISKKIFTSKCPAWVKANSTFTGFNVIEKKAKIIKRIFTMTENGYGAMLIARRLNEEKVEAIGRDDKWGISYIKKILKNRELLGYFQPHEKIDGKRIPVGLPINNYYPQIISFKQFENVQEIIRHRGTKTNGRAGVMINNLFTHLVKCSCGQSMVYVNTGKSKKSGKHYLQCNKARLKAGCGCNKWNYQEFEDSFFKFISDFDLNLLINNKNETEKEKLMLKRKKLICVIENINNRIDNILNSLKTIEIDSEIINTLSIQVKDLRKEIKINEKEVDALNEKLNSEEIKNYLEAKQEFQNLSDRLKDIQNIYEITDIRISLRNIIRLMVKEIKLFNNYNIDAVQFYQDDEYFISNEFKDWLYKNGYETKEKQYDFLDTKKGNDFYKYFERSFEVTFKNGKSIEVKPFINLVNETSYTKDNLGLLKLKQDIKRSKMNYP
jgi:DNA invertase Pin-like site-specific DNA recombinase